MAKGAVQKLETAMHKATKQTWFANTHLRNFFTGGCIAPTIVSTQRRVGLLMTMLRRGEEHTPWKSPAHTLTRQVQNSLAKLGWEAQAEWSWKNLNTGA